MKKIASRKVTGNNLFEIQLHDVKLKNGKIIKDYFYAQGNSGAMIVPVTEKGELVLIEHFRYAINETILNLPGGLAETKNENMLEVAKRELEEETGFTSKKFQYLGEVYPLPGNINNRTYVYLAKDCKPLGKFNPDETEKIKIKIISLKNINQMIKDNKIKDSLTLASLMLAQKNLRKAMK